MGEKGFCEDGGSGAISTTFSPLGVLPCVCDLDGGGTLVVPIEGPPPELSCERASVSSGPQRFRPAFPLKLSLEERNPQPQPERTTVLEIELRCPPAPICSEHAEHVSYREREDGVAFTSFYSPRCISIIKLLPVWCPVSPTHLSASQSLDVTESSLRQATTYRIGQTRFLS